MTRSVENPSVPQSNSEKIISRRGVFGLVGGVAALGILSACGNEVTAKPGETTPPTPEQTSSAPVTPTSASPTPEVTPTPQKVDVPPFREWKIDPYADQKLENAANTKQQWEILHQIIEDNNKPGMYQGDIVLNSTRPAKDLAERTFIELATMADIGIDPNVPNGDKIAKVWAELAIIDTDDRGKFINKISYRRKLLTSSDTEDINWAIAEQKVRPAYHVKDIFAISDKIQHFNDKKTGQDYAGVTFTTMYQNDSPAEGFISTFIVVFDSQNRATQILRELSEADAELKGDSWHIAYNVGEEPRRVQDIPEVKAALGK